MVSPEELLPTLSVCTGLRGLERGVERVTGPLRAIAYVEIEAFIIENLLAGMEAGVLAPTAIWANLKTFDWKPFRHKIFLLVGGYPCQPFSNAGLRKGADDPRHLWPYLEGGIETARPVCVYFENVRGHLDLGAEQVIDSLRALGYAVELGIYSAEEVGAPHQRARLFILGILADAKDYVRGLYERQWRSGTKATHAPGTGEMDDAGSFGHGTQYTISTRRNGAESSGEVLADSSNAAWGPGDSRGDRGVPRQIGIRSGREENSGRFESSGEEMANTNSNVPGANSGSSVHQGSEAEGKEQWKERDEIFRQRNGANFRDHGAAGVHVADSCCPGLEERREQPAWKERQAIERGGGALAHPNVWRQQQWLDRGMGRQPQSHAWPAGPGQQQYDWEEPRVIGNVSRLPGSIRKLWHSVRPDFEKIMGEKLWTETDRNISAAVESRVGLSIDGYSFREDLLRALGNGVVEDQSEYALRDLLRKHFE